MTVYNCWGFSKMKSNDRDKLKQVAANGLKFKFQASHSNFGDYIQVVDIVGKHKKSKIYLDNYQKSEVFSLKMQTQHIVKDLFVSTRHISVLNEFLKVIPVPSHKLTLRLWPKTIFKDEEMIILIKMVNSFNLDTLIFKITTNIPSFYPYFEKFHANH